MDGQFPADDGEQRLQPGVVVGLVLILVLGGPIQFLGVLLGLGQVLPDDGGGGHAGDGSLVPLVVDALGVLAQGQLHGGGGAAHHGIHPLAGGLDGGKLAADGVGRAGTGDDGGHAGGAGLLKAAVHGVDGIDGPQVGGAGVGGLVAVVAFKADSIPEHTQVAVGIHETGQDVAALGVDDLPLPVLGALLHGSDLRDLAPGHGHIAAGDGQVVHGVDGTVDDEHSCSSKMIGPRLPSLKGADRAWYDRISLPICFRRGWDLSAADWPLLPLREGRFF